MGMAPFANAQITLFTDDFETNYNDAVSIDDSDNTWYTYGTDFTFPATNIPTEGAEGSDWHVKLQRNGSDHIDVSNMSSGVYLLKVYSKNRNFVTKKLIIN